MEQLNASSGPDEEVRDIKRKLYAQGALIMFKPFRTLSDLYEPCVRHWWAAYLNYRPTLEEDHESMLILGNMQNYYESFCRTGKNAAEPEFPNDVNVIRDRHEHTEDDAWNPALDLLEGEDPLNGAEVTSEDDQSVTSPLVVKLTTMHDSLFTLTPPNLLGATVTVDQAKIAVSQLPKKKTGGLFTLPGRADANVDPTETQQHTSNQNRAQLDCFIGTRVDLLSNIENALLEADYAICPSVSVTAPTLLEANFPTIQQHSNHWTLNEKQHLAFVLISAALLKHFPEANKPDHGNLATQMGRMSESIDALLHDLLPPSGQLVLYLGGSGGTGKSRVIQAFVDFARRWHSMSSHVICASPGSQPSSSTAALYIPHSASVWIQTRPNRTTATFKLGLKSDSCSWTNSA